MKSTLLLSLLMLSLVSYSYTQESKPKPTKQQLDIFIMANTGNVNPNALPLLAINFAKYGIRYSENFVGAPFISWYLLLELKTDLSFYYEQDRPTYPTSVHMWNLDEYLIEGGFQIGNNFNFAFNNLGRLDLELYHLFKLPKRTVIRIGTELELMVLGGMLSAQPSTSKPVIPFDPVARPKFTNKVYYFGVYITFMHAFNPQWSIFTQLNPRFSGDTAQDFKKYLQLRWNTGISFKSSNGVTLGGVIRYQGHNLDMPSENHKHNILFIGSITKSFNFAKNL